MGLLVVTGPPGAGKSTVAALLAGRAAPADDAGPAVAPDDGAPPVVLVAGDAFFALLGPRMVPPWLAEAHPQNAVVIDAAAAATGRFVTGGYDVVYDGVVGPWFVGAFAAAAGVERLDYAVLLPPLETCLARVAGRVGHGFTDPDATRRMHTEFATAGVDPRHVVDGASPRAVADAVRARRAAGDLRLEPAPR